VSQKAGAALWRRELFGTTVDPLSESFVERFRKLDGSARWRSPLRMQP
jgi:hypothetical protein